MSQNLTKFQEFQGNLVKMEDQFKSVLPAHIDSKKFLSVVVTAVQSNPKLLGYERASLFNSCKDCASDGLIPDGREAALVPFKGKVKYIPMVAGIAKRARNSGEIASIDAIVVYENDEYISWTDERGAHFKHVKVRKDRGEPILTYAYAILKEGGFYFEEIDEDQMKAIQKCCNASDTPWKGPFKDEMRRKSALHRLGKYRLPSSSDINGVLDRDNELYDLEPEDKPKEETDEPKKSSLESVVESQTNDSEVVDAEFKPEGLEVCGLILDIIEKKGPKTTKYGCKIGDLWYGTFSTTHHGIMKEAKEKSVNVKIKYETSQKDGKTLNGIVEISEIWDEEASVPDDNVPI